MTTTHSSNGHSAPSDPTMLRQEIARTRAELGDTVEALAAKADVKARAQETVDHAKAKAHDAVVAARLRAREGVEQLAVNAAYAGRELRAHPKETVQSTLDRMRRSVQERPAPWVAASALLILAAVVSYRKGQR